MLVVTGVDNAVLESVLICTSSCRIEAIGRSFTMDVAFTKPTSPFLSESNRAKEYYFRYAIFLRADGRLAKALGNPKESHR